MEDSGIVFLQQNSFVRTALFEIKCLINFDRLPMEWFSIKRDVSNACYILGVSLRLCRGNQAAVPLWINHCATIRETTVRFFVEVITTDLSIF